MGRRLFYYFPMFTLTSYLVQFVCSRLWTTHLTREFPLLFGIGMGLTFSFCPPKAITEALKKMS
jgi:hypothetical protein